MNPTHFYDSASPENVPSGVYAAVYINGDFRWPEDEIRRMSKVFGVSVEKEPSWARLARCIDLENGAGGIEDAAPFIKARLHYGFDDGTVYVNRSNRDEVAGRLQGAGITALNWVATLDGTMDVLDAWAVQYHGGLNAPFDLSVLHGVNNFHKP